jgi:hypothetical protein
MSTVTHLQQRQRPKIVSGGHWCQFLGAEGGFVLLDVTLDHYGRSQGRRAQDLHLRRKSTRSVRRQTANRN